MLALQPPVSDLSMQSSARAMQEPCRCERTGRTREDLTPRDVCNRGTYAGCEQEKGSCGTHSRVAMRHCGPVVRTNERRNGCEVKYLVGGDCWRMNCSGGQLNPAAGFIGPPNSFKIIVFDDEKVDEYDIGWHWQGA